MKIKELPIEKLQPADYNPRKDLTPADPEYQKLKKSIEQFGYVEPILLNERSGRVIGGHQRLKILIELGYKKASSVCIDVDEKTEQSLNIALNKIKGEWDLVRLEKLLYKLDGQGVDIAITGFSIEEMSRLFNYEKNGLTDEDYLPEITSVTTKPNDLYSLNGHKLLCADATIFENVKRLMADKKADMVYTDPPYNVDYVGKTKKKLKIKHDNQQRQSFIQFVTDTYSSIEFALKAGGCFYISHSEGMGHDYEFRAPLEHTKGLLNKQTLVWIKDTIVLGRQDYNWQHEPILYGWKQGAAHYFCQDYTQTTKIKMPSEIKKLNKKELFEYCLDLTAAINKTVIEIDRPKKSTEHPTMKPVALIQKFINNSTYRKQIVCDIFLGSGSTLIACEKTDRICYGMEIDPHYCDVAIKRWEDYTGNKAKRI